MRYTGIKSLNPQHKKITDSAIEPLTLSDIKLHLRVDGTTEDTAISAYQKAARLFCEDYTGRAFINQTWQLKIDDFPSAWQSCDGIVELPRAPLSSVTSVVYLDNEGVSQTLSTDIYAVDTDSTVGNIHLKYNQSYPSVRDDYHGVTITYVAGYGANAASVPEPLIQAIKLLTGHFYEQREPISFANNMYEVPLTVNALLDMYRLFNV